MNFFRMQLALVVILSISVIAVGQEVPSISGWFQIPRSNLRSVCPPDNYGGSGYSFRSNCRAVVTAWNSGAFDTARNRLLVWGGGHTDYSGNEIYAVNMNTLNVERLTNPAVPIATNSACTDSLANGTQPNSRHTYDGIAYMANTDRLFVFGGSPAPCGGLRRDTWTLDLATRKWQKMDPTGHIPSAVPGIVTAYDPNTGLVFIHDDKYLYSYSFATNSFQRLSKENSIDYHLSSVIDPVAHKFIMVGAGNVYVYDIGPNSTYDRQKLTTTGGSPIVNSRYPGLAYDSSQRKIVAWNGGDTVYVLDVPSATWTPVTYPDGPGPAPANGTYDRWSYSQASGVFVLVNSMDTNAYILRLPHSTADNTPPTAPSNLQATPVSSSMISIAWATSTDNIAVAGYRVYRGGTEIAAVAATNSYQDTNLSPSTNYCYSVAAYDFSGNSSDRSESVTATTFPSTNTGRISSFQVTSEISGKLPFTIGLVFKKGDIPGFPALSIPESQVIVKRRWSDGSVKHAIASGQVILTAGVPYTIGILGAESLREGSSLSAFDIEAAKPSASVRLEGIGTVDLSSLLGTPIRTWISGPEMVEAHYRSSVGGDPTLAVTFQVQLYKGGRMFIRAVVENGYLDTANATKKYIPTVSIGGTTVYTNDGTPLLNYAHTRWSTEGWIGGDPKVTPAIDTNYLKETKLVPNYLKLSASPAILNGLYQYYSPMQNGGWTQRMGNTGYQQQIGLLPRWDAIYITSGADIRAFRSVLANAKALNSYPIVWSDIENHLPTTPSNRPNWTVDGANAGGETTVSAGPLIWDVAHHGSGGYLAYLITGDYYYLETMQHQSSLCYLVNSSSLGLGTARRLLGQTRGSAWCQRTIGQLAAIGPSDAITDDYRALLESNVSYWNAMRQQPEQNLIGYLYSYEIASSGYGRGKVAPWQQAFWVQTYGYLSDLEPLSDMNSLNAVRDFLYKSAVGILGSVGTGNYCYTKASQYSVKISDTSSGDSTTWYDSWGAVFQATYGTENSSCGAMLEGTSGGDPANAATGYWGNLLPAIAYAVDHGATGASDSWTRLTSASNWSVILNSGFNNTPNWGIFPRVVPKHSGSPQAPTSLLIIGQ